MHTASTTIVLTSLLSLVPGSLPLQASDETSNPQSKRASSARYDEYRVAAGTYLAIELRTRLSSNTNEKGDPVDGRLLLPLMAGDVELVPAGATVLGSVREIEPAGKKKQGHLAFAFHIIEHPETGSKATIRGTVLTFASDPPKKGDVYPEVVLEKGLDASVSLLAPLTVRIPRGENR